MSTETKTRTILGLPIEGKYSNGRSGSAEQWDAETLLAMVQAVLAQPGVKGVVWAEYTPYFNDGDVCEFRAYMEGVLMEDATEDEDAEYEWDGKVLVESYHMFEYDRSDGSYAKVPNPGFEQLFPAVDALDKAIQKGHFDNVLLEYFGDHAKVLATKDGFQIEWYEHD